MADSIAGAPFSPNETGKTRTRDYQIGRGKAWLHELDEDTGALLTTGDTGWRFLGNAVSATASMAKEVIDHITSQSGFRDVDAQIPIEQRLSGAIELEEMNAQTRDYFFSATAEDVTNGTVAGFSKYTMISAVNLGRAYQIQNSAGVACRGIAVEDLTVECGATLLEIDVDYEVDEASGEIFFLSTGEEVEPGDPIDVTLDANPLAAEDMEQAPIHSREIVEVSFKFNGVSPRKVNGVNRKWQLWVPKASLVADGEFPLLSPPDAREVLRCRLTWTALKRDADTALGYVIPLPVGGVT